MGAALPPPHDVSDTVFRQPVADAKRIAERARKRIRATQQSSAIDLPLKSTRRISHLPTQRLSATTEAKAAAEKFGTTHG